MSNIISNICKNCVNYLKIGDKYTGCMKPEADKRIRKPVDGQCPFFKGEFYTAPIYQLKTGVVLKQIGEVTCRYVLDMPKVEGFMKGKSLEGLRGNIILDPRVEDYEFWDDNDD